MLPCVGFQKKCLNNVLHGSLGMDDGLKECIENAFHRIGIVSLYQRLANLSMDGASVNTGIHNGLGVKMRESAAWLSTIHCFNHSLELAVKAILIPHSSRKSTTCY